MDVVLPKYQGQKFHGKPIFSRDIVCKCVSIVAY